MVFKNSTAGIIIDNLITTIQNNKDYLSEIDGKIGDGDHGINMNKGFSMCGEKLKDKRYSFSDGLKTLSETLMNDIGGSMGPLYGVFFEEISLSVNTENISAESFAELLNNSIKAIKDIGNAKSGDKTLLDTLVPAYEKFETALINGDNFYDSLNELKKGAFEGWQSTKDMVAKIGRASRLGERSRGVLDAGATSCYLILDSMAESIQKILTEE